MYSQCLTRFIVIFFFLQVRRLPDNFLHIRACVLMIYRFRQSVKSCVKLSVSVWTPPHLEKSMQSSRVSKIPYIRNLKNQGQKSHKVGGVSCHMSMT